MPGMNTLGSAGISDYQSRTVTIEVTGVRQQSVLKTGSYTVRVPYSQMAQALQTINRRGGKVASVQLAGNIPAAASTPSADISDEPEAKPKKASKSRKTSKRR
ncbi:MAG: phycobilisome linker polypeptide [Cyanobacteria bacterium J06631_9]